MSAMAGSERPLRAVILLEDSTTRAAVTRLLYRAGFGAQAVVPSLPDLLPALDRVRPDVVVVDLSMCGLDGIKVLPSLRAAAPEMRVIALVPFETLREATLSAGATAVVTVRDLRPLVDCLDAVRTLAHAGSVCDCCSPPPAPSEI